MGCVLCPPIACLGGFLGAYLGIPPLTTRGQKALSTSLSAVLTSVTIIALKIFWNISLCGGKGFATWNIFILFSTTIAIGVVYSIGVNYLLSRFVFNRGNSSPSCCCKTNEPIQMLK